MPNTATWATTQTPLYEIKANLFKGLAHPARIRVLEILAADPGEPTPVSELLEGTGMEASHLSQHLGVLKRHQVVVSERVGSAMYYRLANPKIAELLVIARDFLADTLSAQRAHLDALGSLLPLAAEGRPASKERR